MTHFCFFKFLFLTFSILYPLHRRYISISLDLNNFMKIFWTLLLLVLSNLFMTVAWYGHLKKEGGYGHKTLIWIILISWGIAFFEYCLMIPANRLGHGAGMSPTQLKIAQEVITISVFVPFSLIVLDEQWKWDYLWAFLCILGAVFFVNKDYLLSRA